jgi:D-sedoheptulose 7-phosphate isomerase
MRKKKQLSLRKYIDFYIRNLKNCLERLDYEAVEKTVDTLMDAYRNNRQVFIIGNGGAASNASHMACDLGKGTLMREYDENEPRFRVVSLTDNVAIMTAFANDLSYEDIFVQQLRNLIEKDDVLIALSGSGNSINIIKAVEYAKKCQAKTIGFLGFKTGGKLAKIVDLAIIADSPFYGPSEDLQLILDHIITSWIAKIKGKHDKEIKKIKL